MLEEEAHSGHQRPPSQDLEIRLHFSEVESGNAHARAPDLLDTASKIGTVEHVHDGALQTRDVTLSSTPERSMDSIHPSPLPERFSASRGRTGTKSRP